MVDLVAGSAAGATAVAFTYPLDLLRTRLAWRTSAVVASSSGGHHHHHRATMASVLAQLARKEGIPGLYKGVSPTLLGIFPYAGLKFFVYQYLKGVYMEGGRAKEGTTGEEKVEGERFVSTPMKLVFGASAGLVAQTITYPLDVVRRRMQVRPVQKERERLQNNALVLTLHSHTPLLLLHCSGAGPGQRGPLGQDTVIASGPKAHLPHPGRQERPVRRPQSELPQGGSQHCHRVCSVRHRKGVSGAQDLDLTSSGRAGGAGEGGCLGKRLLFCFVCGGGVRQS